MPRHLMREHYERLKHRGRLPPGDVQAVRRFPDRDGEADAYGDLNQMPFEVPTPQTPLTQSSFDYWNEHLEDGMIWATPNRAYEFIHRGLVDDEPFDSRASSPWSVDGVPLPSDGEPADPTALSPPRGGVAAIALAAERIRSFWCSGSSHPSGMLSLPHSAPTNVPVTAPLVSVSRPRPIAQVTALS